MTDGLTPIARRVLACLRASHHPMSVNRIIYNTDMATEQVLAAARLLRGTGHIRVFGGVHVGAKLHLAERQPDMSPPGVGHIFPRKDAA